LDILERFGRGVNQPIPLAGEPFKDMNLDPGAVGASPSDRMDSLSSRPLSYQQPDFGDGPGRFQVDLDPLRSIPACTPLSARVLVHNVLSGFVRQRRGGPDRHLIRQVGTDDGDFLAGVRVIDRGKQVHDVAIRVGESPGAVIDLGIIRIVGPVQPPVKTQITGSGLPGSDRSSGRNQVRIKADKGSILTQDDGLLLIALHAERTAYSGRVCVPG